MAYFSVKFYKYEYSKDSIIGDNILIYSVYRLSSLENDI